MIFVGVDPGLEGAIAVLDGDSRRFVQFWDMPVKPILRNEKHKEEIDRWALHLLFGNLITTYGLKNIKLLYEQLWGFGAAKQKQAGQFFYARDYGVVLGVIACNQLDEVPVPPQTWQRTAGKQTDEKYESIEIFLNLYGAVNLVKPGCRTPSPDRAEAGLIAHHGLITHTLPKHTRIKK